MRSGHFMLRQSFSRLVGLITIEALPVEPARRSTSSEDYDATLAQFLAHLAGLPAEASSDERQIARSPAGQSVARLGDSRPRNIRVQHSRVAADLRTLKAELQRALGLVRRRVVRSRQAIN
jgi:hypothetical protein